MYKKLATPRWVFYQETDEVYVGQEKISLSKNVFHVLWQEQEHIADSDLIRHLLGSLDPDTDLLITYRQQISSNSPKFPFSTIV